MGDWRYRGERRKFAMTALWLGLIALTVGVPAYFAQAFWIQCPPEYGYPPGVASCREVENTSLFAGLLVLLSGATVFIGAGLGLVALVRREQPLPALLPIAVVAALLINWVVRLPIEELIAVPRHHLPPLCPLRNRLTGCLAQARKLSEVRRIPESSEFPAKVNFPIVLAYVDQAVDVPR